MSAGLKPLFKRPWSHHVIIVCYIAAPLVNIALLKVFLNVSFATVFSNLVAGYGILATIWLFSAPIVGIALYFVKRFSWYLFLCHSGLILLDFVVKWATRPDTICGQSPGSTTSFFSGESCSCRRGGVHPPEGLRAPYFQVLNRSWRERSRIPIHHTVTIDGQSRVMSDLSTGKGCFVLEPVAPRPGRHSHSFFRELHAERRMHGGGHEGDGGRPRHSIRPTPRRRKGEMSAGSSTKACSLRQKVDIPCAFVFHGEEFDSRVVDVSRAGCYLQGQFAGLEVGSEAALKVALSGTGPHYSLSGRVAWINPGGAYGRPAGSGSASTSVRPVS